MEEKKSLYALSKNASINLIQHLNLLVLFILMKDSNDLDNFKIVAVVYFKFSLLILIIFSEHIPQKTGE